jgi:hypothetical protein
MSSEAFSLRQWSSAASASLKAKAGPAVRDPADVYFGTAKEVLSRREEIKRRTL